MEDNKLYTLEEVCEIFNRSENTMMTHFNRTKATFEKKGIYIERYGTGKTARYAVSYGKPVER